MPPLYQLHLLPIQHNLQPQTLSLLTQSKPQGQTKPRTQINIKFNMCGRTSSTVECTHVRHRCHTQLLLLKELLPHPLPPHPLPTIQHLKELMPHPLPPHPLHTIQHLKELLPHPLPAILNLSNFLHHLTVRYKRTSIFLLLRRQINW